MTPQQHLADLAFLTLLLVAPLPACISWLAAVDRDASPRPLAFHVLRVLILWCATQVSIGLVLGTAGLLRPTPLLLAEGLLLAVGITAAIAGSRRLRSLLAAIPPEVPFKSPELWVLGVFGAVLLTWIVEIAVSPTRNYDALMYHMPTMVNWYQTHSLATLDDIFPTQSRYPYDWELLCTLFLIPFREDFLVLLPNLIAWLVLGLSVHLTAVELGTRRCIALSVTLLALTMPIVHRHVTTPHTDLPLAAFFVAGVFFALRRSERDIETDAVLGILSLALVLGVRTSGFVYGGLLVVTWVLRRWPPRIRLASMLADPARSTALCFAVLTAVLVGGFWQLRNVIHFPDATGFLGITFSATSPAHGPVTAGEIFGTSIFAALDWTRRADWSLLAGELFENLSWQFPLLALATLAALSAGGFHEPNPAVRIKTAVVLLTFITGLAFLLTPWGAVYGRPLPPYDPPVLSLRMRFGFPFFAMLALLGALAARALRGSETLFAAVAITVGCIGIADHVLVAILLAFAAVSVIGPPLTRRLHSASRPWGAAGFVVVTLCLLVAVGNGSLWLRQRRNGERIKTFGPVFAWLESNVGASEVIGYSLSHRSYLLYGKDLNRKVVYVPGVPVDSEDGSLGAYDPLGRRRIFSPPGPNDEENWLRRLRRERVTVFAVGPIRPDWQSAPELSWLDRPGGPFTRAFGQDRQREMVIYRWHNPDGLAP